LPTTIAEAMLDRSQLIDMRERIRPMNMVIHRITALLILFATAIVAAVLVALVNANPAWTADRIFEPAPDSPVAVGLTPTTVTNADFNADGKMDLAAQNSGSDNVSVRLGNGDGTFQAKPDVAVGSGPTSVTSKDFNSDGIADLAVANQNSNNVSVLLGQDLNSDGKGDGTFKQKQDFAVGSNPTSVISANFNGDTYADLAVANYSNNTVSVLLGQDLDGDNKADGTFRAKQDFSIATKTCNDFICTSDTEAPNQVISADFNGDKKADLATANLGSCFFICSGPGGVSVLLGKGDGTFQTYRLVKTSATNSSVPSIAAVDFNGSGSLDLVATEYNSNVVSLLRGNGDGTFQTEENLPVGSNPSAVTSADLDGDSKADDLAVSNYGSNNVSVLFNHDSGGFQAARGFPAGNGPAFVIGADFNADSFADLAVANQNSNNVSVLLNTPRTETTAPITTRSLSPQPNAAGWNKEDVTVTLNATDNDSGVKEISYSINGGQSTTAEQSSVHIPPITNEGETIISYSATDNAGNVEAQQTFRVKLDKSVPSAPVITSPANNSFDTHGNVTLAGTAEEGSTVEVFDGTTSKDTTPTVDWGEDNLACE
jgi:FG-GAP-like repeat/Chitobiase/beta-hexosaminidase C-terminal domain